MENENNNEERGSFAGRRMKFNKKPGESRRKHEWVKPWSARERWLVFGVFAGTIILSGLFAVSSREWKLPGVSRLEFSNYKLQISNLFKNQPIIIDGGEEVNGEMKIKSETIVTNFKETTKNLSGIYGLSVVDLKTSYTFGVYENEVFEAASLIKLPVMAMVYQLAEAGKLDLDKKYTLKAEDKRGGSGSLYGKPVGYEITYRNLLKLMGQQSDNTAFNIYRVMLGDSAINIFARKLGMEKTKVETNETTPHDIAVFFQELWMGNLVNKYNKDELLTNLTDTLYENWLVPGVPNNIQVAHKYGREVHVVNDAGIVFAKKPYVVVILTKGIVEAQADESLPKLSKVVYDGMVSEK